MEKEDCFAYVNRQGYKGCRALNELYCNKEECKFYKKETEINVDQINKAIIAYEEGRI
jgi:hypothetical protein